jgi:YebC/PmpR family DNA-binding regulatory protein
MGRHFEVRAAAMAATGKAKSALYMKASKEIYMAAKGGSANPDENLALRAALEKFKGQNIPKDVIKRAIDKAQGAGAADYVAQTFEGFGPGNTMIVVETLSDNPKRAFSDVRAVFNHKGGKIGNTGAVMYNFQRLGELDFNGDSAEKYADALILNDIDVKDAQADGGVVSILVAPGDLKKAEEALRGEGVSEFLTNETRLIPNMTVSLEGEDKEKFDNFVAALNDLDDVQNVFTNIE